MTFAQLIASKGHTQSGLARHLGFPRQYVNNWTRGDHRPSPDTITSIAAYLDTSTDEVYAALGIIPPDLVQSILNHAPQSFAAIRRELE